MMVSDGLPEVVPGTHVEASGRFIEEDDLWVPGKGHGHGEPAPLAAAQPPGPASLEVHQVNLREEILCGVRALEVCPYQLHHLGHCEGVGGPRLLGSCADAASGLGRAGIAAKERDPAAIWPASAQEDADRRGLAGAVGAEQGQNLAYPDLQVDASQRMDVTEALVHADELGQGLRGWSCRHDLSPSCCSGENLMCGQRKSLQIV